MNSELPEDIEKRINRQVSQLRAQTQHKHDCICVECLTDWHQDTHWPILFAELPRNSRLYKAEAVQAGDPDGFKLCGCYAEGHIRVCQEAPTLAGAVVIAWIAFTLGSRAVELIPDIESFPSDGSNTVH